MNPRILRADDKGDGAGGGTSTVGGAGADAGKDATTTTPASAGDTTLTKTGDAKTDAGAGKDAKGDGKGDAKTATVDYEKWEPKAVEGLKRPEAAVKAFREAGKKFGLSAEVMQGLVDFDDSRTKALADEYRAEQERTSREWLESLKADKELGGSNWSKTEADVERAMKAYGEDPELRKWLNESGDGDRPALVRFVARVGKSLREDSLVGGTKAGAAKKPTLLDQLYGSGANAKS